MTAVPEYGTQPPPGPFQRRSHMEGPTRDGEYRIYGKGSFSPDGQFVLTVSSGRIRVWRSDTGAPVGHAVDEGGLHDASFSPDGTRVAVLTRGASAVYDWRTGRRLITIAMPTAPVVFSVRFSHDGRKLLTTAMDGEQVWDATTGRALSPLLMTADEAWFTPHDHFVVTRDGGSLRAWVWRSGELFAEPLSDAVEGWRRREGGCTGTLGHGQR